MQVFSWKFVNFMLDVIETSRAITHTKKKLYEGSNIHKCNRTESASKMLTF